MGNVINFNRTRNRVVQVFKNLLESYTSRRDEIMRRKIRFLQREAYQYFYDIEFTKLEAEKSVNIPFFMAIRQIRRRADEWAAKAVLDVIASGRLNECYTKRIKQLKEMGIK